ncbi:hypothetical protein AB0D13_12655 [Streptomyces sp. NPDC048430]|uniref:hypothetical protein n=1 Tax=Streptomyces sp. NPDC048430 TaxID=3155388 RepID=UPI003425C594
MWRSIAWIGLAVVLTVSCGWAAGIYAAEVSEDQIEGRWTSQAGTSLTFHDDHTFTAEHFDTLPVASDCKNPAALSSGSWSFFASSEADQPDEADATAAHGSVLSLVFLADGCEVYVYLFGDEDDPAMCPTGAPDAGCPNDGYLNRNKTEASALQAGDESGFGDLVVPGGEELAEADFLLATAPARAGGDEAGLLFCHEPSRRTLALITRVQLKECTQG